MPIYTKTGDDGTTALFGGKRLSKDDEQVDAYGSIDELTSYLGLVISKLPNKDDIEFITNIQLNLYGIMSILAGYKLPIVKILEHTKKFEQYIDKTESQLPKLSAFILPQGGELSSLFQIVRTITRRVERQIVHLFSQREICSSDDRAAIMQYINRLSDLFFILARKYEESSELKVKKGSLDEK